MISQDWSKVDQTLGSAVELAEQRADIPSHGRGGAIVPGGVLLVAHQGKVAYFRAFGCRSIFPEITPMNEHIVFDVASLTKVIVSTTLVMQLVQRGQLSVDRRLSHIFQTFGTHGKERITVRHLLNHSSGYPATAPFYKQIARADSGERAGMMTSRGAVDSVYSEIFRSKIEHLPGKVTKYSDIGFLLLGHALEVISGMHLDKLAQRQIFAPLRMKNSGYIDLSAVKRRGVQPINEMIAPTCKCSWRGRVLCGEVHDENAWAMGGVAAHAGLFTNAWDIHVFASELINCWHGRSDFLSQDLVRSFLKRDGMDPESSWALGWDTPGGKRSSAGQHFSPNSVGHLGYTGCSLWIDLEKETEIVFLTNRIHSSADNRAMQAFRPVLHDLVMETLGLV